MKIRNGFVSNSSSSSFVVAFPRKPKNENEVKKMMFNDKEGSINPYNFENSLSHSRIAELVWRDIKADKRSKQATVLRVDQLLSSRYWYHYEPNNSLLLFNNYKKDKEGYWGVSSDEIYFGTDKDALNELRKLIISIEKRRIEISEAKYAIMKTCPVKKVPLAYEGGKDYSTGKKYTKKQIKDYKKYECELNKWRDSNKKYQDLNRECRQLYMSDLEPSITGLRDKVAKADAEKFLEDNKGCYIFMTSYSDNNGQEGCIMEHGNIFRNLPHIQIGEH